ncbi:hypothetical protein OG206_14390 [Streptomyces sp. NBC_01341]|uniref:hypothetical protein n=1 Tax=Streptomyces sp. NBC_01341 TaxID=2903831 RepID=UPI002E167C66|nr:hypothetical protein OG206_14390 [Streptomyces sp. NBC_01341]
MVLLPPVLPAGDLRTSQRVLPMEGNSPCGRGVIAVAVAGLALAAAGLPDGGVRAVGGLAAAATLWASAYHVAVRG